MARVFTIAPGLENMGGLKTGGQGSVYKGRRIGKITTAVKILPTPIYNESEVDENYVSFQNEVKKLKKVNETPNPHVVKILSSGISEAGNFPYIEMEYIEGPDLEELLHTALQGVFKINEILKVAEQLANALAHCHRLDVKHGDIKSNNVKYSVETGNYILLDFGLAAMSDEQRRSSLRRAGAIEFMAPEQNMGQMLFQTDVYGFGVILFELLTGSVPFKLEDKGESARNEVRLAHMATPVPDLLKLRRVALPDTWNDQKKQREMQVPAWLVSLVNKCLEKKPENRFASGIELHNYVTQRNASSAASSVSSTPLSLRPLLKQDYIVNQEQLKKQLLQLGDQLTKRESELATLKQLLKEKNEAIDFEKFEAEAAFKRVRSNRVSKTSFVLLLVLFLAIGAFAMYPYLKKIFYFAAASGVTTSDSTTTNGEISKNGSFVSGENENNETPQRTEPTQHADAPIGTSDLSNDTMNNTNAGGEELQKANEPPSENRSIQPTAGDGVARPMDSHEENVDANKSSTEAAGDADSYVNTEKSAGSGNYLVVSKAYFYDAPDEQTRRNEFISPLEKAVVKSLDERYGFIYVIITNLKGQVFKGWLRKKELKSY